jgi:hypothetical protein
MQCAKKQNHNDMKGLDNDTYLLMFIAANVIALGMLALAIYRPALGRLAFFLLFAWASWMNFKTSRQSPEVYLEYAELTWSDWYKSFINGWFARNTGTMVGIIAACQALIALSMWSRDRLFWTGAIGAVIFLLAIVPLGAGAGFPCTLILAIAMGLLIRRTGELTLWSQFRYSR